MRYLVQRLASASVFGLLLAGCAQGATLDVPRGASLVWGDAGEAGGGGAGPAEDPDLGLGDEPGASRDDTPTWDPPSVGAVGACSELTHHIYLVSPDRKFYSFHPANLELHLIGKLSCGAGNPLSMAVDRNGVAWIVDLDGAVVRLDIATGRCEKTPFQKGPDEPFRHFGMAFVADDVPGRETLYVRDADLFPDADEPAPVRTLGVFDTTTYTILPVGAGAGGNADLTGTGDGHLFGFVKDGPIGAARVSEFDKITGAALSETPLAGVTIGSSWAFATWGGDFWFFVTTDFESASVYRYDPDSQAPPVLVVPLLLTAVIGAGVSTCVPTDVPL
ncbi:MULTISPECIES: hypothetical protein [Sorangium]|uniref:Secreted protein n=1 Tax=Sorangium cellulosum (strain So ce56) TaxID=448385 RepID=A9GCS1_SORC5|nr:hypothetical protein [Sorangium cellulosum]CAN96230.1 hypothetical protein predicted by Glimmer/Critica [Sorangium cellulosum So ce56]